MTEKQKLIQALAQIENLKILLEGNEYQQYLYGHLMQVGVELKRQLNNYGKTTN